jgi:Uri superfamily endonuclease
MEINQKQSQKGSYSLLIELNESVDLDVGALGMIEFSSGFYVYNGSAFGSGGLKRVERHKEKSKEVSGCHWHIDYLLTSPKTEIVDVYTEDGSDHECGLSQEMKNNFDLVEGFGCTDCGCSSHLFYSASREELTSFLDNFYSEII